MSTAETSTTPFAPPAAAPVRPTGLDVLKPVAALALLFLFLVGVQSLSSGIKMLGAGTLDSFMTAVENPFLGLVTGVAASHCLYSVHCVMYLIPRSLT